MRCNREPIISLIPYNTQNCHSYLFLMVREFRIIHSHTINNNITAVFVIQACTAITKAGHKISFAFIRVLVYDAYIHWSLSFGMSQGFLRALMFT